MGSTDQNHTGLWYDSNGNFTGKIHEMDFLKNHKLEMPFDPEIVGYISVADDMEHLFQWFTIADIVRLERLGIHVLKYESSDYKFYESFQHHVIKQDTCKLVEVIEFPVFNHLCKKFMGYEYDNPDFLNDWNPLMEVVDKIQTDCALCLTMTSGTRYGVAGFNDWEASFYKAENLKKAVIKATNFILCSVFYPQYS